MKIIFTLITTTLLFYIQMEAQTFTIANQLNTKANQAAFIKVQEALNPFFQQINQGKIEATFLKETNASFAKQFFEYIKNLSQVSKKDSTISYKPELINFYSIGDEQYMLQFVLLNKDTSPAINAQLDFIADLNEDQVRFDLPMLHRTRYWKTDTIGTVTYIYPHELNRKRAENFNQKNIELAKKFNRAPTPLTFYMVQNFQEMLYLTGSNYLHEDNGKTRDGYGVVDGVIFAIDQNEDFAHDLVHYYMGLKFDRKDRNGYAEEGMAYYLGNAYYTDENSEMISQERLIQVLKTYLKQNPDTNLLTLYEEDKKIFKSIAPEISVQRTISGIFYQEIESKKGFEVALDFVLSGREARLTGVFDKIEKHLNITKANFNTAVMKILDTY